MGRGRPHALIAALGLVACIPAREPARHLGGEAHFLGAYVAARANACNEHTFELAMAPRPRYVIETKPATYESQWQLRACGTSMEVTLDCRMTGETWQCGAHEWPTPVTAEDYRLAHEIEAVARRAPACPADRSCTTTRQCGEDGLVLRRLPHEGTDPAMQRYDVARCGFVSSVNVRCTVEPPYQCVTTASESVDMLDPTHGEPGRRPPLPP